MDQALVQEAYLNTLLSKKDDAGAILAKVAMEANKLIRDTLVLKHTFSPENEFNQLIEFIEIQHNKGLDRSSSHLFSRLKRMQQQASVESLDTHRLNFQLQNAIHQFESINNRAKGDINIPKVLYLHDIQYHLFQLQSLNQLLIQVRLTHLPVDDIIQQKIDNYTLSKELLDGSDMLKLEYGIFCILKKEALEFSDISNLYNHLIACRDRIDAKHLKYYHTYIRNFYAFFCNIHSDIEEAHQVLSELYKESLTRGYLDYNGRIHPNAYLAVTRHTVQQKENEWALNFINTYRNRLITENESEQLYSICMALYFFSTGQFEKCLDFLQVTTSYVDFILVAKRLELKAYYELGNELLPYRLDAFRKFLKRTSPKMISPERAKTHMDFFKFITQLSNSNPGDKKRAEKIIQRLERNTTVAEWRWLMWKAKELLTKRV